MIRSITEFPRDKGPRQCHLIPNQTESAPISHFYCCASCSLDTVTVSQSRDLTTPMIQRLVHSQPSVLEHATAGIKFSSLRLQQQTSVQTQIFHQSSVKLSDLEQLTAGPWNDFNTPLPWPRRECWPWGCPHMPWWCQADWVLTLAAFGLAPMYTHQFGFGLEKKHWKGLKAAQHTRGLTGLSAHLFALWNPDLPESQLPAQACAGVLGRSAASAASHTPRTGGTPTHPHIPLAEDLMNAPARGTPKPLPDLARSLHIAQDFDRKQKYFKKNPKQIPQTITNIFQVVFQSWKQRLDARMKVTFHQ